MFHENQFAFVGVIHVGTILFVTPSPATEPDHFVVFLPTWKRIVSRMNDDETAIDCAAIPLPEYLKILLDRYVAALESRPLALR